MEFNPMQSKYLSAINSVVSIMEGDHFIHKVKSFILNIYLAYTIYYLICNII